MCYVSLMPFPELLRLRGVIPFLFLTIPTIFTVLAVVLLMWIGSKGQVQVGNQALPRNMSVDEIARRNAKGQVDDWASSFNMSMDEIARRAANGSIPAQVKYGEELFRAGRQEEAEAWFEAAVAGSDSASKSGVAQAIASRLHPGSVSKGGDDIRAAERWYRRSFDLGSDRAAVWLGLLLWQVGDPDEADRWFERAVERNSEMAYWIAINLDGRRDGPRSGAEAALRARWLRRGAELGDKISMRVYAEALRTGMGVERSETEAFRWYEAAARHPRASVYDLLTLAELYADGVGTPPDRTAAAVALDAAKGKSLDSSDTILLGRIKSLERRLNADGAAKR